MSVIREFVVRSKRWSAAAIVVYAVTLCRLAVARERIAVLIVVKDDIALSDGLTEVAISKLADKRNREFVGLRELLDRFAAIEAVRTKGLDQCVIEPQCLQQVGALADLDRAVIGTLRRRAGAFEVHLELIDVPNQVRVAHFERAHVAGERELIAAVRDGVDELFQRPTPPLDTKASRATRAPLPNAPSRAGAVSAKEVAGPPLKPERPRYVPYVSYGAAALGLLAFSAAAVTGSIAVAQPRGSSRSDAQADLRRREGYAHATNGLLIAGGVTSAVSAVSFVWYFR